VIGTIVGGGPGLDSKENPGPKIGSGLKSVAKEGKTKGGKSSQGGRELKSLTAT
jgi:hypothetical protein